MNKLLIALSTVLFTNAGIAQCDSVNIQSDMTVSSTTLMSGIYVIDGTFTLQAGATIYVTPYSTGSCGALKIYADNIVIDGEINGDFAGYEGGTGGDKGLDVSSITGHGSSLTSCNDAGSQGHIAVEGGLSGENGSGTGGGLAGTNGGDGSGTKQYCGNFGDEAGIVGGAAGAGGGAGGSYGGTGSDGDIGGNGSNVGNANGIDVEGSYPAVGGTGGSGGSAATIYGTETGRDVDMGSGGAGAGGGGRSYYIGTNGGKGGAGGGLVFLQATSALTISGTISVLGENGTYGGAGGSGDATADCCSDGCSGCDERTFSCGAGAGSGSGAGSGGGIFIESLGSANVSGTLIAAGGEGGLSGQKGIGANCDYDGGFICGSHSMSTSDGENAGAGGSGGGGRVKIFVANCALANITAQVDVNGGVGANPSQEGTYAEVCGYLELKENDLAMDNWYVYPNPFSNEIHLIVENEELIQDAYVNVLNAIGENVYTRDLSGSETMLYLDGLQAGVYFIRIVSGEGISTKKIIRK